MPLGKEAMAFMSARRLRRSSGSSAITNTLSKNASAGFTSPTAALSRSGTVAAGDTPTTLAAATRYASYSATSSGSFRLSRRTSKSAGSSLPRTSFVGRASTVIAALSSSDPAFTTASSARAVSAANAGSPRLSVASTARTASTPHPLSTRYCSSRRVTYSMHSSTTLSPHATGCSAAAACIAARRSHRTPDTTSACTAPYAARRNPKGSAVALGAPTTANRPTRVSRRSATATAMPAGDLGRMSPAERGSAASKMASHSSGLSPSRCA
mmetsp:Transcript_39714/g.98290  ORF Transcript_39714/g.98290 Transcript_39714/m.98290 type:complete len:269 (+) Transcript_39714:554-1360(+)